MAYQINSYFFTADNNSVILIADEGQMALRFVDDCVANMSNGSTFMVQNALHLRDLLLDHYRGDEEIQVLSCTPVGWDDREDIGLVYVTWDGDTPDFSGLFPQTGWKLLSQWLGIIRKEAAEEEV